MKTLIILLLLALLFGFIACRDGCTDCDQYTRTLALYVNAQGNAKDSISRISGNMYNVVTGTRSVFVLAKKDSVYSRDIEVFENIDQATLELDILMNGDTKHVTLDLTGKLNFTESRVQIISINVIYNVLGIEVSLPEYIENKEIESDLEITKN